jgi:hypothetical protein
MELMYKTDDGSDTTNSVANPNSSDASLSFTSNLSSKALHLPATNPSRKFKPSETNGLGHGTQTNRTAGQNKDSHKR